MRRILEVFGEPIISGGQEAFVNNVVESINWDDLCIDLFTPYYCGNSLYKNNVERRGGEVFAAKLDFIPGNSRFNIKKPLERILKKKKYDVIHVHSGSVSVLSIAAKTARENEIETVIVHSHSPAQHETFKHFLVKIWFHNTLLTCPNYYFACSLNAALCKFPKSIAIKRTRFIKNGIDLEKYRFDVEKRKSVRRQLNVNDDEFLIGHVGRFSKEKNHEFLLHVIKKLSNSGFNSKLVLIGDGDLKNEIQQKVYEMQLDKVVIFTGNVPNVNDYMQAMDCFVLPSLYEGLPFVGVEAQASGLSVIVSTGVSPELNITRSIQYEPLDIEKWAKKIQKCYIGKREDNIPILREAGFDIKNTAEELRKVYVGESD